MNSDTISYKTCTQVGGVLTRSFETRSLALSGKPSGIMYSSLVIFWKHRYSFLHRIGTDKSYDYNDSLILLRARYNTCMVASNRWLFQVGILCTHGAWKGGLPDNNWHSMQPRAHRSELEAAKRRKILTHTVVHYMYLNYIK